MSTWPEEPGRSREVYLMNQDRLIRGEISPLARLEPVCQLHNGRNNAPSNADGGPYCEPDSGQVGCDAKTDQRVTLYACRASKVPGLVVEATAGHALPDDFEISNDLPYGNTCEVFAAVYRYRTAHNKVTAS